MLRSCRPLIAFSTRRTLRVFAALVALGCGGGGGSTGPAPLPTPPAVAGTYHLSGTQTTSNTPGGGVGVSFDGTLVLTQTGGVLAGTAAVMFVGGKLGSRTRALTGGPVEGVAVTVVAPDPSPGGYVQIRIQDAAPTTLAGSMLVLQGTVAGGGTLSGTLDIAFPFEEGLPSGTGTWRADRL